MEEELTPKKKIEYLKGLISYNVYCKILKVGLTKKELCQIYDELLETDGVSWYGTIKIVSKPKGDFQDSNNSLLKVWVNQTTNGGYTGDDFAGDVYVKLKNRCYLKWGYHY